MSANQREIAVIVNGTPTLVKANVNAPLHTIIPKALEQTGNIGQPPDNWELRDAAGMLLDPDKKIEEYDFPPDVKLFLNLKAGVGGEAARQYVDPAVSLAKYDQEIASFRHLQEEYRRRGWFLIEAEFPEVFVVMASVTTKPPAVVTGVLFDFTNYDAEPPSVRLVDPFTREAYRANELPTALNRAMTAQAFEMPGLPAQLQMRAAQPLMQAHTPEEVPFLCIAGVREYHNHPGHSGDVWELHRAAGAGKLVRLLDIIHHYGVEPIRGYAVQLVPQVGFEFGEPPE
jgi:Predicted metal binding domain/Protein of Unknown function (DUF2604)